MTGTETKPTNTMTHPDDLDVIERALNEAIEGHCFEGTPYHLMLSEALSAVARVREREETSEEALLDIDKWSKAYPPSVFPEPDFKKAHEVLTAAGMTLDAISASNMRHVVNGVGKIASAALAKITKGDGS